MDLLVLTHEAFGKAAASTASQRLEMKNVKLVWLVPIVALHGWRMLVTWAKPVRFNMQESAYHSIKYAMVFVSYSHFYGSPLN